MAKADLRICTDCGCVYNREVGLRIINECPACKSDRRKVLDL